MPRLSAARRRALRLTPCRFDTGEAQGLAARQALPVLHQGRSGGGHRQLQRTNEIIKQRLRQHRQRNLMRAAQLRVQVIGKGAEDVKGRLPLLPEQRQRAGEVATVRNQIPVPRKAAHALHLSEGNVAIF